MTKTSTRSRAGFAAAGAFALAAFAGSGVADAATNPFPYTDSSSINQDSPTHSGGPNTGGFQLLDASNNPVSCFSTTAPLATVVKKVVAIGPAPVGYRGDDPSAFTYTAVLSVHSPNSAAASSWSGQPFGQDEAQPNPATANVFYDIPANAPSVQGALTGKAVEANGYYELRLRSATDGDNGLAPSWYTEDIQITGTSACVAGQAAAVLNPVLPEVPLSIGLPLAGFAAAGGVMMVRRRRRSVSA